MKVKWLVGALVVLVIINIAALGSFWYMHHQAPPPGPGFERSGRGEKMERRHGRNLSRDERRRLFRAMRSFHQDVRPLIDQTDALEEDLIASMKQDPVPRARVDSLLEGISQKRLEIARLATDRMIAMGDSLAPEDRERMLDALMRFRRGQFDREGGRPRFRRDD